MLSGIDISNDAAGLLSINSDFVEALIVGANHELARELLWRGVPLNRTSTLLTRFFESRVSAAPRDVTPISDWKSEDWLGSHISLGERSILILRSRLISHLSETAIFLAKAEPDGPYRKPGSTQIFPLFRGFVGLDTTYFGFEISPEDMASDQAWYFVIQELSGATRFGLDEVAPTTMTTWNDLPGPLYRWQAATSPYPKRSLLQSSPEDSCGARTPRTWRQSRYSFLSGFPSTRLC